MGMDKYGYFMQMYAYYYWNHSQQSMKCSHVSIRHEKNNFGVPITSLSLHWEIYLHNPVYIITHRAAHFFWTCKMYIYH